MAAKPVPAVNPAAAVPAKKRKPAAKKPAETPKRRRARRNPPKLAVVKLAVGGGVAGALAWAASRFLPAMGALGAYIAPAAAIIGALMLGGKSSTRDIAAGMLAGGVVLAVRAVMPSANPGRVHVRPNPSSALLTYAPAGSSTYAAQVARGVAL